MDGNKETTLNQYKSSTQYQKTWNSPTYSEGIRTVQFINHYTSGKSGNVYQRIRNGHLHPPQVRCKRMETDLRAIILL